MDYGRPELADRLAAEYVLGTLRGPARRRFESLLGAHALSRDAVAAWQRRLMPLLLAAPLPARPAQPSARVWQGIERRLFAERTAAAAASTGSRTAARWWQRLALWQSAAAFATIAAIGLGVLLTQVPPAQPPIVVVLQANPEAAGVLQASFVASLSADGRSLVLKPVNAVALDAGRALELWAVPGQGAPRSLGLVSGERGATVLRANLLQGVAAFAVSLEPAGGSPTGAPTGPIVSVGKLSI